MTKIVVSALAVAAIAAITVATGNPFLGFKVAAEGAAATGSIFGLSGVLGAAVAGGLIGIATGALSMAMMPKPQDMEQQAGSKLPISNAIVTRKIIYGKTLVGGSDVFIEERDTFSGSKKNDIPNDQLILVRCVADHPVKGFGKFYMDNELVKDLNGQSNVIVNADAPYSGKLQLVCHDGKVPVTVGTSLAHGFEGWSSSIHKGAGLAFFEMRADFDQELFPYGVGVLRNCNIEVEGKEILDPRTASTAFSNNPAICVYDYLRDNTLGNPMPDNEIDTQSVVNAANICDELVPVSGGGTIKRFTLDGVIDCSRSKYDNVQLMLSAMGGQMMWLGGKLYIFASGFRSPVFSLTDEHILSLRYQPSPPLDSRYACAGGTFISPPERFESQPFPTQEPGSLFEGSIEEAQKEMSINLPFTQDHRIAQRLAKVELNKSRQPSLQIEAMPIAATLAPMDTVTISHTNLDVNNETYRIIDQTISGGTGGKPLTVSLSLIRERSEIYDWDPAVDEKPIDSVPQQQASNPLATLAPKNLSASTGCIKSNNGTESVIVDISWDAPHASVAGTLVDIRYQGDTLWTPLGSASRDETSLRCFVAPDLSFDIQARHRMQNGVLSAPALVIGLTSPAERREGPGVNFIPNARFSGRFLPWDMDQGGGQTGANSKVVLPSLQTESNFKIPGAGSLVIWEGNALNDTGAFTVVKALPVPVDPNKLYEVSMRAAAQDAKVNLIIWWLGSDGALLPDEALLTGEQKTKVIGSVDDNASPSFDGTKLQNYTHVYNKQTGSERLEPLKPPAAAAAAMFRIEKRATQGSATESRAIITQPYFGEAFSNQTEPSAWVAGPETNINSKGLPVESVGGVYIFDPSAPLSASESGGTAQIDVQALTLWVSGEGISYAQSSIAGLLPGTGYHVYMIDPELAGGAIPAEVTTDRTAMPDGSIYLGFITTPSANSGGSSTGTQGGSSGGSWDPDYQIP